MRSIGLNGIAASLCNWEISTNLLIEQIDLPQLSIIYSMKVTRDSKYLIHVGVTPGYVGSLVLLEGEKEQRRRGGGALPRGHPRRRGSPLSEASRDQCL